MTQLVKRTDAMKSVQDLLTSKGMQSQLAMALPKHVSVQRLTRIVLTELRRTPALLACTRESLLGSILQAAQLGLEVGVNGEAWIIPFGMEATFVPGYRGLAQLAWRSQQIASLSARAVFEGDVFTFDFGDDTISHRPCGETDPARLTHAYAIFRTVNGGRVWDVMTRREIDAIRARSRAGQSGPWVTDYVEMAKKTVFRRAAKLAPCSAELQRAMALADAADAGMPQGIEIEIQASDDEPIDVTPEAASEVA